MPLPPQLPSSLTTLRTQIRDASHVNVRSLMKNVQGALSQIQTDADLSENMLAALYDAGAAAEALANLIADRGIFAKRNEPEIEQARNDAYRAVDALEKALDGVQSSNQARILGYGW